IEAAGIPGRGRESPLGAAQVGRPHDMAVELVEGKDKGVIARDARRACSCRGDEDLAVGDHRIRDKIRALCGKVNGPSLPEWWGQRIGPTVAPMQRMELRADTLVGGACGQPR